jgi:VanZ family protein
MSASPLALGFSNLSRVRYAPFALAALAVVGISVAAYTGHTPIALSMHGIDKVLHASMTLTLTYLLGRALKNRAWLAGILVMVPVSIDEYMQRFSSARSSDWWDLAADLTGVTIAIVLTYVLTKRNQRNRGNQGAVKSS